MCAEDFNSAAANTPPTKRRRDDGDNYESEDMYIASLLVALSQRGDGPSSSAAEAQNQTEPSTSAAVNQTEYSPSTGHHPPPSQDNCHTCNICGRGFPSYQALGGHKTGHTKLSAAVSNKRKNSTAAVEDGRHNPTNGARLHTCATCGESFPSGQALGGHKRRHYPGVIRGGGGRSGGSASEVDGGGGTSGVTSSSGDGASSISAGVSAAAPVRWNFDMNFPPPPPGGLDLTLRL
ncbi:hypothetical protein MIMGU_mgv1a019013mg [Erythranthe guttata]|uniref:C2H2-type domain-containing protein n=1 Tax=Erythranthe guttata TaxID=4155 RepID=A0A022RJK2_ERYGU|nr:PREDICTED: zinc finger protein 1-like [Erythranthe guttata]EYU39060.1 hypothetical protein MIMGU_mgv1a019013mg [Erythranthe guttata]|eukprot:XP_012835339.1 PREDICTED: zinc finger protein 1-like [Erythranthe guttata]